MPSRRHQPRLPTIVLASIASLALAVTAGWGIYADRATLQEGLHCLDHLSPAWLGAAAAAQTSSMAAFALQQKQLVHVLGGRLTLPRLLSTAYEANAISFAVPVIGSGLATSYAHRQFRRGGVEPAAATFALTLCGVVSTVAFATVIVIGSVTSGNPTVAAGSVLGALVAAATVAAIVLAARSGPGRNRLARLANSILRLPPRSSTDPNPTRTRSSQACWHNLVLSASPSPRLYPASHSPSSTGWPTRPAWPVPSKPSGRRYLGTASFSYGAQASAPKASAPYREGSARSR